MIIVNLTPHEIFDVDTNIKYPTSGTIARVTETITPSFTLRNGTVIYKRKFSDIEGLPEPKKGYMYIVSHIVKQACPTSEDLITPGQIVRDDKGNPIGCKGFFI